ncbi:MAG TPA: EAL domain-containing protein [Hyphomicrobiales bacterium]|nr:EAL domain-containing protein [Hyphomicrobiales bacterium]
MIAAAGATAAAVAVGAATALVSSVPAAGLGAALGVGALLGVGILARTLRDGQRRLQAQIEALSGITVELARRMTALERRPVAAAGEPALLEDPVDIEGALGEIGTVVRLLAEQVAEHDLLLSAGTGRSAAAAPARASAPLPAMPRAAPALDDDPLLLDRREPAPSALPVPTPEPDAAARLRAAVAAGAVELQLRPMVGLPQRRTVHYEIATELRDRDGTLLGDAGAARAVPRLAGATDALVLDRALRIAGRLKQRGRAVAVFVAVEPALWADDPVGSEIVGRLVGAADLAEHLVLEISHAAFRRFGALERDLVAALSEKGFGIALSGVADLGLDPKALRAQGIRFVKVAPPLLLAKTAAPGAAIHPDDLAGFLRRHGITLIADPVEREGTVAELIDIQVALVQGPLFGAARPVRPEVFALPAPPPPAASAPPAARTAPEPQVGDGVGSRFARRA